MNAAHDMVATAPVVSARHLRKAYKNKVALDDTAFEIPAGRIIGLIGPNGAGKTTALKAMLGLIPFEGELKVLGLDPRTQRDELMRDVCFIADVAVLPRWIRVREAIDFVAGVHPRFDRARCERFIAMMLDGLLKPGDALPSVRQVAAEYQLNPITVSRAYQELADEALVEKRRGLGMYVTEEAARKLLVNERERFLREEWPVVLERIQRLGLSMQELMAPAPAVGGAQ